MQLHLIDGTYELFRAHYGQPARSAPDGSSIQATYGIVAATLGLLDLPEVTHVAAAFDTVIESFRNDMFPGYKTSAGMDPELLAQFPVAEDAMRAIGVTVWSMIEWETDDAIATAAVRWADDFDKVVVHSPDKDMFQLYGHPTVVGYNRREQAFIDADDVVAKFGIGPGSIPDYLALVGDSADGYPGLPGWGAKSTSAVLAEYGRIEDIPDDAAEWGVAVRGAAKLAATLAAGRAEAALYKDLAVLRTDVPLAETIEDLEWHGVPRSEFEAMCEAHGFTQLRSRPRRWRA